MNSTPSSFNTAKKISLKNALSHLLSILTERWHHQTQMRDAVGVGGIRDPELFRPVLETFMLGIPHAFRKIPGDPGQAVRINIIGDCGGICTLMREQESWKRSNSDANADVMATIRLDQELVWRLFTNSVDRDEAARLIDSEGDSIFLQALLRMVAIMAPIKGAPPP